MRTDRRARALQNWMRKWTSVIFVACPLLLRTLPASAEEYTELSVAPSPQPVGPEDNRAASPNLQMSPTSADSDISTERRLVHRYESKRIAGIVLAGVVAPMIAGFTAFGAHGIYRHGLDDGGFCNHVTYDEWDDEYGTDCEGDRGEVAGIVLLSTIGGIAGLAVLIPGIVMIAKSGTRLRHIRNLGSTSDGETPRARFAFTASSKAVAIGFRF